MNKKLKRYKTSDRQQEKCKESQLKTCRMLLHWRFGNKCTERKLVEIQILKFERCIWQCWTTNVVIYSAAVLRHSSSTRVGQDVFVTHSNSPQANNKTWKRIIVQICEDIERATDVVLLYFLRKIFIGAVVTEVYKRMFVVQEVDVA